MNGEQTLAQVKSEFTADDVKAHAVVRELLWLFYPQDQSASPSEDSLADQAATAVVEALKARRTAFMG